MQATRQYKPKLIHELKKEIRMPAILIATEILPLKSLPMDVANKESFP